ncbi:MAG: AzlD domain-containing protein [Ruminiclostridium sp.]
MNNFDITYVLIQIAVMAGVTYLIRMLPLTLMRRKIKSRFVNSFLFYVPFTVLAAMTFPTILHSTSSIWSALAGLAVAVLLSFLEKGLLTVALSSCAAVLVVEILLQYVFI